VFSKLLRNELEVVLYWIPRMIKHGPWDGGNRDIAFFRASINAVGEDSILKPNELEEPD
jgi:hypothetical protein